MDVIAFGQQGWHHCWVTKQHLLSRLARRGHQVLFVDPEPATTSRTSGAVRYLSPMSHVETLAPGLFRVALPVPAGNKRVSAKIRKEVLRRVQRRLGMDRPVAVCFRPDLAWLMDAVNPRGRLYYAEDEWTGFAGLTDAMRRDLRHAEEHVLRTVDVALAVSPRLVERMRQLHPQTRLLENAVDTDHFSPAALDSAPLHPALAEILSPDNPSQSVSQPRRVVGFVGQVDHRLDRDLLAAVARDRPGVQFVLVGRVIEPERFTDLVKLPNVHLVGYVPYEQLPAAMKPFDACMLPYVHSELTESCNPLKLFEYMATGRPVVARPLAGIVALREVVRLADVAESFKAELDAALADPAAGREARLDAAGQNTWEQRTLQFEAYLEQAAHGSTAPAAGRAGTVTAQPARLDANEASVRQKLGKFRDQRLGPRQRLLRYSLRFAGRVSYAARFVRRRAAGLAHPDVRTILVVRRGYLGDTVVFAPTLEALRRTYPQAKIVLGVQPGARAAGALLGPLVDEVRPLDFNASDRRQRMRAVRQFFAEGFDLVLWGSWYSNMSEGLFTGAPAEVGLWDGHPYTTYADLAVPLDPMAHESENSLALAEAACGSVLAADRVPHLRHLDAEIAAKQPELDATLDLPHDAKLILLHPGSKRPTRRWAPERFAEVAERILRQDASARVVITGVPDEVELARRVAEGVPAELGGRVIVAAGRTDLLGLLALLDRAAALVCNDTGIMHVARSRGTPLLAVLGPENEKRWGPHPFGAARAVSVRAEVPCAPCSLWQCDHMYCLRSTSVDTVFLALLDLLNDRVGSRVSLPVLGQSNEPADVQNQPAVREFHALEARTTPVSWQQLQQAGFVLPRVSVLLRVTCDEDLAAGIAAVRRQTYPNLDVLLLDASPDGIDADALRPLRESGVMLQVTRDTSAGVTGTATTLAGVAAALRATKNPLISLLPPEASLAVNHVGDDVACLLRGPDVLAVRDSRHIQRADLPAALVEFRVMTLTREACMAALKPPAAQQQGRRTPVHGLEQRTGLRSALTRLRARGNGTAMHAPPGAIAAEEIS